MREEIKKILFRKKMEWKRRENKKKREKEKKGRKKGIVRLTYHMTRDPHK